MSDFCGFLAVNSLKKLEQSDVVKKDTSILLSLHDCVNMYFFLLKKKKVRKWKKKKKKSLSTRDEWQNSGQVLNEDVGRLTYLLFILSNSKFCIVQVNDQCIYISFFLSCVASLPALHALNKYGCRI